MEISIHGLGKRFQNQWIFRNLSLNIPKNSSVAITGNNGSGKSTLLKVISSISLCNEGEINYSVDNTRIDNDSIYQFIEYVAPYSELIEELTLKELLDFHNQFKRHKIDLSSFKEFTQLKNTKNKLIRNYSSGMKQRVKLGLAFLSDSSCLFLDEPTSNLDEQGIKWYTELLKEHLGNKTIIISSNMPYEYQGVDTILSINDFKQKKQL